MRTMDVRWKILLGILGGAAVGAAALHLLTQGQREPLPAPSGRVRVLPADTHFYVCETSVGDPEAGRTPGALEVVPAARPSVSLDGVVGSGFDDVRRFLQQMESAERWRDLFIATSPSKGASKTNVLLIGPQGCGKTEVLRAVASNPSYAAIFAQGSDFLTCWSGEASKNPKRLFEAAKAIHTRTGKRVFILIDEIDQILHSDPMGDKSLAREFQVLMDGILDYPMISVWGATNYPGRIPQPMMRRFTLALIVGELDQRARIQLLRQFCGKMSVAGFADEDWERLAMRLEGATGDVIRKVIEPVSRAKMQAFVEEHRDVAEMLRSWIDREGGPRALQDDAKRSEFDALLAEHVAITPADLDASIAANLGNLAVLGQIRSAQETYAEARRLLRDMQTEQC